MINKKQKKIKIVFIIDAIQSIKAGTEKQLHLIINSLDKTRYDITLICLRDTEWILMQGQTFGCKIKCFKIRKIFVPVSILSIISLVSYIKKIKPNVALTLFKDSNIIGVIAAKIANVKYIISTRRDYGLWIDKKSKYFLALANIFANKIIANSKMVKSITCANEIINCDKVDVIYNGMIFYEPNKISTNNSDFRKKYQIPSQNKLIGIVANLRNMKRHYTFLKAAKLILNENENISFIIVGDGYLREKLIKQSIDLEIDKNVIFVGSVDDVTPFLKYFDIGINCSANEGLSNAIMEYMYYKVPCIVSDAGGNSELIKHGINGYNFELDNHEELARLTLKLLKDKDLMSTYKEKAHQWVTSNLNVAKMISRYETYFNNCAR